MCPNFRRKHMLCELAAYVTSNGIRVRHVSACSSAPGDRPQPVHGWHPHPALIECRLRPTGDEHRWIEGMLVLPFVARSGLLPASALSAVHRPTPDSPGSDWA